MSPWYSSTYSYQFHVVNLVKVFSGGIAGYSCEGKIDIIDIQN